jgi:hypothetical protein
MATPVIRQKGHLPSKIFALPLFYEKENAYYETWKIVLWDHHTGNLLYADGLLHEPRMEGGHLHRTEGLQQMR